MNHPAHRFAFIAGSGISRVFRLPLLFLLLAFTCAEAGYFDDLKTTRQASNPALQWKLFGPGMSGYIDMFWINNGDPNAMYDTLDMGNGHVTLNRGLNWKSYQDSDGTGNQFDGVTGIEFSYQNPDFGLLIAKNGIFSSNDRGQSWNFLVDADLTNTEKHNVVTVDPTNDSVWYIGAGQGWQIKFSHYNQTGLVYSEARNHSKGFILRSTNKGLSWTKITSIFPADSDFSKIIVDPGNPGNVYASCQSGIYRSTNGGTTWARVSGTGLPHHQPRDMASYYNAATGEFLLYMLEVTRYTPNGNTITTSGGVYRSADGGTNWTNLTGNLPINLAQINSPGYRDKYWTAIAYWLGIDKATAQTTYPTLPTSTFSQFIRIDVDPTNKDRIYLVHNFKHDYSFPPGNIWMTENGGTNWFAAAREGPYWANQVDKTYWQSRNQPLGVNVTYAHVQKEHTDTDYTETGPRFLKVNSLGEIYTAFSQQIMRSTDRGVTWKQIDDDETFTGSGNWIGRGNSNLPGETFCLETGTPGTYLFGSGEHGLWRTTDDGGLVYPGAIAVRQLTGQSISSTSQLSIAAIAVHPNDPKKIYTLQFRQTQRGSLRHSADAGATWQTLSTPIVFPGVNDVIDQRSLLIDPVTPGILYFCVPLSEWEKWAKSTSQWIFNGPDGFTGHGIYKSTDGGLNWTPMNTGIPAGKSVYRLAMDPANPQVLYAALNETHTLTAGGLYKTTNGGGSWSPVAIPAGVASVNEVVVHKTTGDLYIACGSYKDSGKTGGVFVLRNGTSTWQILFNMPNVRGVSPSIVNPNIIAVNVGEAQTIASLNSGAYVTIDGAQTWHKINRSHGQPEAIRLLGTDPSDEKFLWCGLHGTGFARMDLSPLLYMPVVKTFAVLQDADVDSNQPTKVFGLATPMKLSNSPQRLAYVQFDVSGLSGTVTSAKLRILNHATSPILGTLSAYASTNGWDQSTVTWNLKHDLASGSYISQRAMVAANAWHDLDVTSHVNGNGLFTIGLSASTTGQIYSKETGDGTKAAYLEVTTVPTEPAFSRWMTSYGLSDPGGDNDGDGFSNQEEYVAGTVPTNSASRFSVAVRSGGVVEWTPFSGRVYDVYWSSDLKIPFQLLQADISYPRGTFTDSLHSSDPRCFYKLVVRMPNTN